MKIILNQLAMKNIVKSKGGFKRLVITPMGKTFADKQLKK